MADDTRACANYHALCKHNVVCCVCVCARVATWRCVTQGWAEVLRRYEEKSVYLAECAQLLVRNVNYEVPALKQVTISSSHYY